MRVPSDDTRWCYVAYPRECLAFPRTNKSRGVSRPKAVASPRENRLLLRAENGSRVPEMDLADVYGRGVTGDLIAGANFDRTKHGSRVPEAHLVLVRGRGVADHLVPRMNLSH